MDLPACDLQTFHYAVYDLAYFNADFQGLRKTVNTYQMIIKTKWYMKRTFILSANVSTELVVG